MGQTGLSAGQTLRPGSPVGCLRFSALSSPFVKGGQSVDLVPDLGNRPF